MDEFDSVFANAVDDDTEFDTIFGAMEDGELIDIACGFNEAGECETDFDELHQTDDDATPDDFEGDLGGEETDNAPADAEGTDDSPLEEEGLEDKCPEFQELHQTNDDATVKDLENDVVGGESDDLPKNVEGDEEHVVDTATNEEFDIIHQTADDATEKDLDKEVVGKETDNAPKDAEGTDDEPVVDLTGARAVDPDEEDIEGEIDKIEEEFDVVHQNADDATAKDFKNEVEGKKAMDKETHKDTEGTDDEPVVDMGGKKVDPDEENITGEIDKIEECDFDELHQTADDATEKDLDDEVVGDEELDGAKDVEGTDDEPVVDLTGAHAVDPDEEDIEGEIDKIEEETEEDMLPGTDESDGEITDGENADNEGLPEETMDEMMERLLKEAEEDEEEVDIEYEPGDELLIDDIETDDEEEK